LTVVSGVPGVSEREILASRRLLRVSEWELQQLLLDIHDGPVQAMYAALSQLDRLTRAAEAAAPESQAEVLARADRIRVLLETGLREIRSFIGAIRPPHFERQDLRELIESFAIQHETTTDTAVHLEVAPDLPEVPVDTKIALYRVVQEALSNAYRHGGAERVDISVRTEPTPSGLGLVLEIVDNGAGFVSGEPSDGHFGLRGMRDRVEMLGGDFHIASTIGTGTEVRVVVPLFVHPGEPSA
jgi:signal transduction histidine kinase